ncbi:MAG: DUF4325 domain-containing protein [Candidatus Magasanikbacteria bacterium]|nr:DUF4325 domain-containing protein [Candidatus Magasanikbacteria bacterium]
MVNIHTKIETEISALLYAKRFVRTSDLVDKFGVSRAYAQAHLRVLVERGVLMRIGETNASRYMYAGEDPDEKRLWKKVLQNKKTIDETAVLDMARDETRIFSGLSRSLISIVEYAFTEILNNAKEHSSATQIRICISRKRNNEGEVISFTIKDNGVGIFRHIQKMMKLHSPEEAIERLLKGKQTTMPRGHSGEGIFFTSKIADVCTIRSDDILVRFDTMVPDIFVGETRPIQGTELGFEISTTSKKNLIQLFEQFCTDTDELSLFDKTLIHVKAYQLGGTCISRSQAKRVVYGLDAFNKIILDFSGVTLVGQGFADEIFRVWQFANPQKVITPVNANDKVLFMIRRASKTNSTST